MTPRIPYILGALALFAAPALHAQRLALPDTPSPGASLRWAARIDSLAELPSAAQVHFAHAGTGLITVHDSTDWPDSADAEIAVFTDPDGLPRRHVEIPQSQSGDWSLTWATYFDSIGRTRVFISTLRYFREDCGEVVIEERQTVFRPDFTVTRSTRHRLDRSGVPREASGCGHPYTFSVGNPRPTYVDLVDDGRAPPH
jgi:hypothetical protein